MERIQRELDEAKLDKKDAEADLAARQQQEAEVKAMVDVKKQEVSSIDARKKLAEKSKQEVEKTSLEAEKKDAERFKQFLEKRWSCIGRKGVGQGRDRPCRCDRERARARARAGPPSG
jgi:hypothetical protein